MMRFVQATMVVALILAAGPAAGEEVFVATLTGTHAGTGSPGTGAAQFTLSDDMTEITYYVEFSGLLTPEIESHIHRPLGGIAFDLGAGNPKMGVWQFPLPVDVQRMRDGELYVNVHTSGNTMGEISGTIGPKQLPIEGTTWGAIKALYARR